MNYNEKTDKRTAAGSFIWKMLERLFSQGVNLVVQIALARLLLPENFGGLAILVVITNYAAIFVQSGLATAIVQKQDLDDLDVSTVLSASLAVSLVMYIALFAASPLIAEFYAMPELKWALRTMALILFLNAINSVQTAILSRRMQFKKLFLRSALAVPLAGAVGIIMAIMGFGLWALVVHNLLNMLIVVIFISLGKDMHFSFRFSKQRAQAIYRFGGKILVTNLIMGFHDTLRTMVIGKKYSATDLAYYDKAYTYSNYVTQIINTSVSSVLLPVFSRAQSDIMQLRGMARRSVKLSTFVMCPVLFGVAMLSEALVRLLLTDKWLECAPYLAIFCLLRLPGCMMTADKQVYYAIGKSEINLFYEIGLFLLNIITLLITMQYNTMAIAIGATVIEFIGVLITWCISARVYDYRICDRLKDIAKPVINSSIMAVVVWSLGQFVLPPFFSVLLQISAGVVIYVLLSLATKDENFYYILSIIKSVLIRK